METEAAVWSHSKRWLPAGMAAGVLVVKSVIPGSCADAKLEPGDIITRVESSAPPSLGTRRLGLANVNSHSTFTLLFTFLLVWLLLPHINKVRGGVSCMHIRDVP